MPATWRFVAVGRRGHDKETYAVRILKHLGYDAPVMLSDIDTCVLDNRRAPEIRTGGEIFTTYYSIEWCYHIKHIIDPRRSYVHAVLTLIGDSPEQATWEDHDILHRLMQDLGLWEPVDWVRQVAFRTLFPRGTERIFTRAYHPDTRYETVRSEIVRVLNNPFFYADRNASERRLVEIASDDGLRFALDRAVFLPTPEMLSREIALLNHGFTEPEHRIVALRKSLEERISREMDAYGLVPWRRFPDDGEGPA